MIKTVFWQSMEKHKMFRFKNEKLNTKLQSDECLFLSLMKILFS